MWLIASLFILLLTGFLLAALLMKTRSHLGRPALAWRGAFRIALLATAMSYAADYPVNAIFGSFLGSLIAALVICFGIWMLGLMKMINAAPERALPVASLAACITMALQLGLQMVAPAG
jgi:hypothetical protein